MSSVRFEPIAVQLSKVVHLDVLLPRDVIETLRARLPQQRPALEPAAEQFLLHYRAVLAGAIQLLGAPQFERAGRWYDRIQEEFKPAGPPSSPVYDSFASQTVLADVPHGLAAETPCSALAWLTRHDPARERFHQLAHALTESHHDLYRVLELQDRRAQLQRLRDQQPLTVHETDEFLRSGDLIFARVLPFAGAHFLADPPYLLRAAAQQWLQYLQRATPEESSPPSETRDRNPTPKAKLSTKQRARLRQKKAQRDTSSETSLLRHLKHGASERYWFEYILNAYAGERRGVAYLAGIPDLPETLPHHEAFDPRAATSPDPLQQLREALIAIAQREGISASAERVLQLACEKAGIEFNGLDEVDLPLFTAYCSLGARSAQGLTALEHLARQQLLEPEQRALLASLERGWFSALRVDQLHDGAFDAHDLVQDKALRITESKRQLTAGDLLLGWLCEAADATLTLEGNLLHIPRPAAAAATSLLRDARNSLSADAEPDWKRRAAELPLLLILGLMILRRRASRLELVHTTR